MMDYIITLRIIHSYGEYSKILMFTRDKFHLKVIVSDDDFEIYYEGHVLWLVCVYASNGPI